MVRTLVLAVLAFAALTAAPAAASVKSPADIAAQLEQERGVKVLKLQETQIDGRPAYVVSIMNSAGDTNAAFQVEQILVDAETGAAIPTFRHGPTGWSKVAGTEFSPSHEGDGQTMRRMTFGTP